VIFLVKMKFQNLDQARVWNDLSGKSSLYQGSCLEIMEEWRPSWVKELLDDLWQKIPRQFQVITLEYFN